MDVFDEYSNKWFVRGGMPAMSLVNRLHAANYTYIVLPAKTLATGKPITPSVFPEDVVAHTRLLDCLHRLELV